MAKLVTLTLLGVFMTIFVAVSAEEEECPLDKMYEKSVMVCEDEISEENFDVLEKNGVFNEEIKNFLVCVYTDIDILKDDKFDFDRVRAKIDGAMEDKEKAEMLKTKIGSCVDSANQAEVSTEVVAIFHKCVLKIE